MRISCSVRKFVQGRHFPFVAFFIKAPGIAGHVDALIDTGSPFTVLSPKDIMSFRLPIKSMQRGETVKLAGSRFFNHPLQNAVLYFRGDGDTLLKVELPSLGALIPTKIDEKTLNEVKVIPSILGNDFLEDQRLTLTFNPSGRTAFLEKL